MLSLGFIYIAGGKFEISSADDGMHADSSLMIEGGTIHVSESYEGLEGLSIDITGGDIDVTASDDGLNAAGGNDSSGGMGGRRGSGAPGQDGRMKRGAVPDQNEQMDGQEEDFSGMQKTSIVY